MPTQSPEPSPGTITRCLQEWRRGDTDALSRLASEVYRELRRISAAILNGHRADLMLQPTVLIHELYLKLPDMQENDWESRAHFFNVSARMMRNILVDHARGRQAARRGGEVCLVPLEGSIPGDSPRLDVLMVHDALDRFAVHYPRQARTVELRFFGGLTNEETVEVFRVEGLDSSVRTVQRDWNFARAWLQNSLGTSSRA